jgi:hypothetical protein
MKVHFMFQLIFHEKFVPKLDDAAAEGQQLCKEIPSMYIYVSFSSPLKIDILWSTHL